MKQINETTWQSDNRLITFIHGDCMDFMEGCRENEFDLAVVDPPYGIGLIKTEKGNWGQRKENKGSIDKKTQWDFERPKKEYFDKLFSVSKNQIIWGGNYFIDLIGKPTSCFIVWDKKNGESYFSDCEIAYTSFKTATRMFRKFTETKKRIHICQKPIELYRWIFKNYAKPTDHILDTHGGSMSSAIAAHMEGLKMTIIELDKDYFDSAIMRFSVYESQQSLNFEL